MKKIYKADGDAHSWDWLAMVSPCVDVLRRLATRIHTELGSHQGSKHTVPDLKKDLNMLMESLKEHEVYTIKAGRVLDPLDSPIPDILSTGFAALTHGTSASSVSPLEDFNIQFNRLRERRRLIPVSAMQLPNPANPVSRHDNPGIASSSESPMNTSSTDAGDEPVQDLQQEQLPDSDEEDYPEDLFIDSPTLTRLEEDDVVLDMDDWSLEEELVESGSEDEDEDERFNERQ